jgi:hypothetical protein
MGGKVGIEGWVAKVGGIEGWMAKLVYKDWWLRSVALRDGCLSWYRGMGG